MRLGGRGDALLRGDQTTACDITDVAAGGADDDTIAKLLAASAVKPAAEGGEKTSA